MVEIIEHIEQGEPEWFLLRVGSIGGSSISKAVAGGKGTTRTQLMWDLLGELISGEKKQGYVSKEMETGMLMEPKARELYELIYDVEVKQIALYKDGSHRHYSPDGLIGNDGLIEIKWAIPSVFAETILTKKIATDRRRQCQWGLGISGRSWCDYAMYCPVVKDMNPLFVIRLERDEKEIAELKVGADMFIEEMLEKLDQLRGMG